MSSNVIQSKSVRSGVETAERLRRIVGRLGRTLRLTHADATRLVAMGPSAWHTTPADTRARLAPQPEPLAITASFTLTTYRPR